jgi:hypothetical protein
LFHNLRATRETELAADYPIHVVSRWLGHTAMVAAKHYLQVTDADFERAAKSGAVEVQNPVQQPAASSRKMSQVRTQAHADCGLVREVATCHKSLRDKRAPKNSLINRLCGSSGDKSCSSTEGEPDGVGCALLLFPLP